MTLIFTTTTGEQSTQNSHIDARRALSWAVGFASLVWLCSRLRVVLPAAGCLCAGVCFVLTLGDKSEHFEGKVRVLVIF